MGCVYVGIREWKSISVLDRLVKGYLQVASSPDLPASFGTQSEAEGLVSQIT